MGILYNTFFILFSIGYFPYLVIKGKFHKDFLQKFGFLPKRITRLKSPVWIHAVSVGEANLAVRLSAALKDMMPEVPVIVSTTTRTGNELVRKNINKTIDEVFYYPLDITTIVRRVIKTIRPRLYLIVETEIWPNIIEQMYFQNVPVAIVNGRLSDPSFRRYRRISFITKRIFKSVALFCMQSHLDAFRIKELGADPEKVFVTGNLKFDELSTKNGAVTFSETKLGFSKTDNIIVAGSTHYPEENMIIDIFKRLKEKEKALKLILAPRHIERTGAIRVYCDRAGIKYERLSRILQPGVLSVKNADMILVDTIGHLKDLYRLASIVFIGGSIADKGGQNPIEAAVWGKPVIYGPNMNNFRQVSGLFLDKDAACRVKDEKELEIILADLVNNPLRREEISRNAGKVISENTGAIDRTIDKIERFLRNIA